MERHGTAPKRIPYGMQNFEDVILRDCYCVGMVIRKGVQLTLPAS